MRKVNVIKSNKFILISAGFIVFLLLIITIISWLIPKMNMNFGRSEIIAHDTSFYSEDDEAGRTEFFEGEQPLYLYLEYENPSESAVTITVKEEYGSVITETDYELPGGIKEPVKTWLQIAKGIDAPVGEHKITVAHKNNPEKIITEKIIKIIEKSSP